MRIEGIAFFAALAFACNFGLAHAADPAAEFVGRLFTDPCVHNIGKPDLVRSWAAQKKLSVVSDPRFLHVFAGDGPDGAVWSVPDFPGNVFLSLMVKTQGCVAWARAANPVEVEAIFKGIVNGASRSDTTLTVTKDEWVPSPRGKVHDLRYSAYTPSTKMVAVLSMLAVEQPGGAFQARLEALGGPAH
jgi:hypothetical protein